MAIEKIGGVAPLAGNPGTESGKQSFASAMGEAKGSKRAQPSRVSGGSGSGGGENVGTAARAHPVRASGKDLSVSQSASARERATVRMAEQVHAAQQRLDHVLRLAESGKTFSPAELLALQAQVYRASQQLDLAGKVVEKATSGVKQILQTQV